MTPLKRGVHLGWCRSAQVLPHQWKWANLHPLAGICWFVFFLIGLHLPSLRTFTICPGLGGKSPSVCSAVRLNKPSRTRKVGHGERPRAWLAATGEQQPGDAASGAGTLCGGSGGGPRPLPPTGGAGSERWGSCTQGCGQGRRQGRRPAGLPEAANTRTPQAMFLRKVKQFYSTG